jgi:hypothetical protein
MPKIATGGGYFQTLVSGKNIGTPATLGDVVEGTWKLESWYLQASTLQPSVFM